MRAALGVTLAARNANGDGTTYPDAIRVQTARLDRGDLLAVLGLLATMYGFTLDDLARGGEPW
jgi:hypothetical protein